jgi:hypothetical protein
VEPVLIPNPKFVVCLRNEGYEASLEVCKIYRLLPDVDASNHQMLRVVDESGEDYLYPAEMFEPIDPPQCVLQIFKEAA